MLAPRPRTIKCYEFIGERGEEKPVMPVIAPIKVAVREDGVDISWGCSFGEACLNPLCRYSKGYKQLKENRRHYSQT